MNHSTIIGIDTAKNILSLHGADEHGSTVFQKTLKRNKVLPFLAEQRACTVALECCGGSHWWGREIGALGHAVKLIPANYVKPYVKRQKNDANDAAAIAEAASRASMRSVAVKSTETQAHATLFRTRAMLVKQRTQTMNAIRGHLAEFGIVQARGKAALNRLWGDLQAGTCETSEPLPAMVLDALALLFEQLASFTAQIEICDATMAEVSSTNEAARRYQTVPGVGPVTAFAMLAFAGDLTQFRNGREFAAWIGLTPRESSTGGRQRLGGITKMGQRDLRTLLVQGAMTRLRHCRARLDELPPYLQKQIIDKPAKVVAVAWANRTARILWKLAQTGEDYDWRKARGLDREPVNDRPHGQA